MTTEDVARAARQLGLSWHRTTVGQTERGNRTISAPELLLLPLIYGRPLRELLPPEKEFIWLTDDIAVTGVELRHVLDKEHDPGMSVPSRKHWYWRTGPTDEEAMESVVAMVSRFASRWPAGGLMKYMVAPDEAEAKAAKKLETTPEYLAYAARELWGRGLTEEREDRLADRPNLPETPRALQAARGHITRSLIEELEPQVRRLERGEEVGDGQGLD